MSQSFRIPLSMNAIDAESLGSILDRYNGRNPIDITDDFEKGLQVLTGSKHAIALNSGTAAIHLGLKMLGVGEGDLVIAPTFTYVASVSPLLYLKAEPVLVDCDPNTWNMDPALVREAIESCIREGKKPKAIIIVHIYGMPVDIEAVVAIAREFEIPILEDAAEGIGSLYNGQALGTWGDIGALSFNNNKILTTYGGGAVLVNDPAKAAKILQWATHAREDMPWYEHLEEGYNYRISPMSAAAGLVGLQTLADKVHLRRLVYRQYRENLGPLDEIQWQQDTAGSVSNRWLSCMAMPFGIEKVRIGLFDAGIETRPLWKPMHEQPLFRCVRRFLNGTADALFMTGICLPSGSGLSSDQVAEVVEIIIKNR